MTSVGRCHYDCRCQRGPTFRRPDSPPEAYGPFRRRQFRPCKSRQGDTDPRVAMPESRLDSVPPSPRWWSDNSASRPLPAIAARKRDDPNPDNVPDRGKAEYCHPRRERRKKAACFPRAESAPRTTIGEPNPLGGESQPTVQPWGLETASPRERFGQSASAPPRTIGPLSGNVLPDRKSFPATPPDERPGSSPKSSPVVAPRRPAAQPLPRRSRGAR